MRAAGLPSTEASAKVQPPAWVPSGLRSGLALGKLAKEVSGLCWLTALATYRAFPCATCCARFVWWQVGGVLGSGEPCC